MTSPTPRSRAESLLAGRLATAPELDAPALERMCAQHPDLAPELRDAFAGYLRARAMVTQHAADSLRTDEFEDRGEIGRGGMGVVRHVYDGSLRRELAAKMLRADLVGDPRAYSRFVAEAQVTSQLDHPGIVPVHCLGTDAAGRPFFTMKLVRGRNLADVFADLAAGHADWTVPRAVGVLLRVCEAVDYAHEKGVVHRDLKPQNIMVGPFGEVFVMDWGLARVAANGESALQSVRQDLAHGAPESPLLTGSGEVLGTPYYMAPEQARGDADSVGVQSDIYSLGAMLYHLLSGEPPYQRTTDGDPGKVRRATETGPPASVRSIAAGAPRELVAVCERAMARRPRDRYPDMKAVRGDLSAWLEGRVVRAYEGGAWPALRKWVRRNRVLAAALGVVAIALPTIVGLWSFGRTRAREAERATVLRYGEDLSEARSQAAALFPAWPELVPALESWLRDRGEPLLRAEPYVERMLASLAPDIAQHDAFAAFLRDTYQKLVTELRRFGDPENGTVASVQRRLAWARSAQAQLDNHAARWHQARDAIAAADDVVASAAYRAVPIHLEPELDLVPIGMNPVTKLWEFHHLPSAGDPSFVPQHEADGTIHVGADTGIVFVLVPGGRFVMGADQDPASPYHDPNAEKNEGPAHEVSLSPFFIARCETSVSQWSRLWGYRGSLSDAAHGRPATVDLWADAVRGLGLHGLSLPTEAQWEYAARAGTTTPYWTGPDVSSLRGKANLADEASRRSGVWWPGLEVGFDDGFPVLAPIDALPPNPWGLHSVHGNVAEWIQDTFVGYDAAPRAGDGLRGDVNGQIRITRGGDYSSTGRRVRSTFRGTLLGNGGVYGIGVRAARKLRGFEPAPPPGLATRGQLVYCAETRHHYGVVDAVLAWDAAQSDAQARSLGGVKGHLVTLTTPAESAFVTSRLPVANTWLGAFQDRNAPDFREPAGGWTWVTGEPFRFTSWGEWSAPEPSNFYHGGLGEAPIGCAEDVAQFWLQQPSCWNDVPRHPRVRLAYVIEFDTTGPAADGTTAIPSPGR